MTVDAQKSLDEAFRDAMASVCTPVAVITAMDGPRPHGTTVSAFASLSTAPPSLLVSLDLGSDLLALIRNTGRFGVNVLGADQAELALAFARKGSEKFSGVEWSLARELPRLRGTPGWFACDVMQMFPVADHMLVTGAVRAVDNRSAAPLTYHARSFGTHRTLTGRSG